MGDPYGIPYKKGSLVEALSKKNKLKIGFNLKSPVGIEPSSDAIEAIKFNAKLCEDLGHDVEEMNFSYDGLLAARAFTITISSHVTQMFNELKDKLKKMGIKVNNAQLFEYMIVELYNSNLKSLE